MKFYQIPIIFSDKLFFFNQVLGALMTKSLTTKVYVTNKEIPKSIIGQYQMVLNPFKSMATNYDIDNMCVRVSILAKFYGRLMVFTSKYSFIGAIILAKVPFVKYSSTKLAIASFKKIYPGNLHQRTLCLPRTLFAVATSKSFKKNGVAFVGVFLPSRKMHAWVIEDNLNPDPYDDAWICYQPVAAITKRP